MLTDKIGLTCELYSMGNQSSLNGITMSPILDEYVRATKGATCQRTRTYLVAADKEGDASAALGHLGKNCDYDGQQFVFLDGTAIRLAKYRTGPNVEMQCVVTSVSAEVAERTFLDIERMVRPFLAPVTKEIAVSINWFFRRTNKVENRWLTELVYEELHDEAYPAIGDVDEFVDDFMSDDAPILVLMGTQGMGKSRLIRYVLQRMGADRARRRRAASADDAPQDAHPAPSTDINALYTMDTFVLRDADDFYVEYRCGDYAALVIEDADNLLVSRRNGNDVMHKFLATSDGLLQNRGKKMIISTNLPMGDIDPALLRPGRCFAKVDMGVLSPEQARALYGAIAGKRPMPDHPEKEYYTVADVYQLSKRSNVRFLDNGRERAGFKPSAMAKPRRPRKKRATKAGRD